MGCQLWGGCLLHRCVSTPGGVSTPRGVSAPRGGVSAPGSVCSGGGGEVLPPLTESQTPVKT